MRNLFSKKIQEVVLQDEKIIFVTGDLGYNALENLRNSIPDRFINAGVAEQNMIGMAAGLAYKGFKVFCYSIAPFITYRCLEQIRLDVCIHKLPVFIVGNGGGYGYGIMGATHHAIEDLACLSSLPNIDCWIPNIDDDVPFVIDEILKNKKPAYLRLGKNVKNPFGTPPEIISQLKKSPQPRVTIISQGAVTQNVIEATENSSDIDIFTVSKLPLLEIPINLKQSILQSKKLLIVEEHVFRGGLSENVSLKLLENNIQLDKFKALYALGYPNELYGSQSYHQKISGLDKENILKVLTEL
ncbi:MAG: transketolase [Cytophagales bacterium]|nr:MAG: transketolase [Cytophagales bacterium]